MSKAVVDTTALVEAVGVVIESDVVRVDDASVVVVGKATVVIPAVGDIADMLEGVGTVWVDGVSTVVVSKFVDITVMVAGAADVAVGVVVV